jgi:hypothetical protein
MTGMTSSTAASDYATANKNYFNNPTLTYDDHPKIIELAKRYVLPQFIYVFFMLLVYLDQQRPYENITLSMKIQH